MILFFFFLIFTFHSLSTENLFFTGGGWLARDYPSFSFPPVGRQSLAKSLGLGEHRCLPVWPTGEEMPAERTGPGLWLLQWCEARGGEVRAAWYLWASLSTWHGLGARPRGVAAADGQQECRREEGGAEPPPHPRAPPPAPPPAGRGTPAGRSLPSRQRTFAPRARASQRPAARAFMPTGSRNLAKGQKFPPPILPKKPT